jgi:hypothetical protein
VSGTSLALVIGAITFVVIGAWSLRANRAWSQLLAAQDERLAYDPIRDPIGWARGGRYRVTTWLTRLRRPDANPTIEVWRIRTANRFVVWVALTALAFILGGALATHVTNFVRSSIDRYGSGFGLLAGGVLLFVLGYYAVQLGRSLAAFGDGRRPTLMELVVAVGGITAALIAMAVLPNLDLSKP